MRRRPALLHHHPLARRGRRQPAPAAATNSTALFFGDRADAVGVLLQATRRSSSRSPARIITPLSRSRARVLPRSVKQKCMGVEHDVVRSVQLVGAELVVQHADRAGGRFTCWTAPLIVRPPWPQVLAARKPCCLNVERAVVLRPRPFCSAPSAGLLPAPRRRAAPGSPARRSISPRHAIATVCIATGPSGKHRPKPATTRSSPIVRSPACCGESKCGAARTSPALRQGGSILGESQGFRVAMWAMAIPLPTPWTDHADPAARCRRRFAPCSASAATATVVSPARFRGAAGHPRHRLRPASSCSGTCRAASSGC